MYVCKRKNEFCGCCVCKRMDILCVYKQYKAMYFEGLCVCKRIKLVDGCLRKTMKKMISVNWKRQIMINYMQMFCIEEMCA